MKEAFRQSDSLPMLLLAIKERGQRLAATRKANFEVMAEESRYLAV